MIPVGPPDPAAREAIWDRYLRTLTAELVADFEQDIKDYARV